MGRTTNSNILRLGNNIAWDASFSFFQIESVFFYIPFFLERLFFQNVDEAMFIPGPMSVKRLGKLSVLTIVIYDLKRKSSFAERRFKRLMLTLLSKVLSSTLRKVFDDKLVVVFHVKTLRDIDVLFILNYFKLRLLQKFSVMEIVGALHKLLAPVVGVKGYRVDITGRYGKQQRASKLTVRRGSVTLSSFSVNIRYVEDFVILKHGKCGFKVWLNRRSGIASSGFILS
jgi:hypothetical protein